MSRIGRNDPCPCGSGAKFKKCHGGIEHVERIASVMAAVPGMRARHAAREHQRIRQQGHGRPIIAAKLDDGSQFVAVRNRLMHSKKWKTFHDFLIDYLKEAIGSPWGNAELKKPLEARHPILRWYDKLCEQSRLHVTEPGRVHTNAMTGAVAAYLHLAYNLYALDHDGELQDKLIARLKNPDQFPGARYEVQAAAILVRAGFRLEFEDEDDGTTTHCEFTATHPKTGKQFSVEAKRSESGRITRQLVRALKKAADHTRIVFIDLNTTDRDTDPLPPAFIQRAFDLFRRFETLDPQAQRLPPAYVFLTNTPWEHHLDQPDARFTALADGFHIPEFKLDHAFQSMREAVDGRQAHIEMHDLLKSMRVHMEIPSTFDGDNPELAFTPADHRLVIGNRYTVPDAEGREVDGVLASAAVMEAEGIAMCALNTDDGRGIIFNAPLSEAEIRAWKKHPETFFGEVSRNRKCETPLDWYDFFMESFAKTPKTKLLEFLAASHDIEQLRDLDQQKLANIYCERMATHIVAKGGPQPAPLLRTKWQRGAKT